MLFQRERIMSLKKKIALSFIISSFVIAILSVFEYINFIEIRKEIRHLEITDTIRSKSLQLRRHEKNFFLYWPQKAKEESEAVYRYLSELDTILNESLITDRTGKLSYLKSLIAEYGQRFNKIESTVNEVSAEFDRIKPSLGKNRKFFPLIELTFLERPLQAAAFLEEVFLLSSNHKLVIRLRELDSEINTLRKNGEEIITISKELDRVAREDAENVIHISQAAIFIFFPLFFVVGIGTLFIISSNIVKRLKLLIDIVEKTGKGVFSQPVLPQRWVGDEVGTLIQKFNDMEKQLAKREEEIDKKNKELLQSKKLAAIGTLASGVAHELNNPLNNIYISAQVLQREAGKKVSPFIKETLNDIISQSIRVKGIVSDLLEFARGREPRLREVELNNLITGAYKSLGYSMNLNNIKFVLDSDPNGVVIYADPEQMERVFINLFTNAFDAMNGKGGLTVKAEAEGDIVRVEISDTGGGMSNEAKERVFEPFFTTKDKGTGLGLAIVFNIIRKHNGEINVESEEGKGTMFTIVLPKIREQS